MLPLLLMLAAAPTPSPAPLQTCAANELSLAFDGEGGAFDGMSQSGALLVLRNIGPHACATPGLPTVTFKDAKNKPLPITRKAPMGMRPGPVVRPVGVAAGAELTAALRWVAGPVYPQSRCYDVAYAAIEIAGTPIQTRLGAHICGAAGKGVTFGQPVLQRDPVL